MIRKICENSKLVSWKVERFGKFGWKGSWKVKSYGKHGRKVS